MPFEHRLKGIAVTAIGSPLQINDKTILFMYSHTDAPMIKIQVQSPSGLNIELATDGAALLYGSVRCKRHQDGQGYCPGYGA